MKSFLWFCFLVCFAVAARAKEGAKLCAFDYDVSHSAVGFPDSILDRGQGTVEWMYSNGDTLVFENRYLMAIRGVDGKVINSTQICAPVVVKVVREADKKKVKRLLIANTAAPTVAAKTPRPSVVLGMTVMQALGSDWGAPMDVNRTRNFSGSREQWVYGSRRYLYFENGILVSIQD